MASRKKKKLPPPVPRRAAAGGSRRKTGLLIIGIGLICGAVLGGIGAIVFFTTRPRTIDLGVVASAESAGKVTDEEVFAAYGGSASCRECHAKEYESWAASHHGLAERPMDPALDNRAFDPPRSFKHGSQRTTVKMEGGKYEVATPGPGGGDGPFTVARVIGVDPLRQFLVSAAGGRFQVLEASYDPRKNEWFDVFGDEDRMPGEWGHWTGRGMNWNSQCAACHNTRVRKNYDAKTDSYHTAMAQRTVSCESCHGPMKQHADEKRSGRERGRGLAASAASGAASKASSRSESKAASKASSKTAGSASNKLSNPRNALTKDQMFDACGSCHSRRRELTGDFVPGDAFDDHYSLAIPDRTDIFYADGQVKDEDYEFTAFLGSKMHAAGVRCVDCHDPHTSKRILEGNLLCMRCHNGSFKGSPVIVPERHSFHKTDSAGNQCVNCHMPQTTYMQRHVRHDHGFTIPDPTLTMEFKIPNACNRCHTDKDAQWALAAVEQRYGAKMRRPTRERARWIARARRGEEGARPEMLRMLRGEKQPFWRAAAAGLLGRWARAADARAELIAALGQEDPLVRENAARSLEPAARANDPATRAALAKRLDDPRRSVRIAAAWGLRDSINEYSRPGGELVEYLRLGADQPGGAMQQGVYLLARNQIDAATRYFSKAVAWDPNSAPFHESLAMAFSLKNQPLDAIRELQAALRLEPREAEYAYRLAQAYDQAGDVAHTIAYFKKALRLNPGNGRAAYNLGLAYAKNNQLDEAVAELRRAEAIDPRDADIPYARATIHLRLKQADDARRAARRALELNPGDERARRLLEGMGG